jgi:uncharacterized coiled-coil protein SlyX
MVIDDERIENKIDKIFDEITEQGKIIAVQEQKLREINHRMSDGQQRNSLAQELLRSDVNKRMDNVDRILSTKVDIEDYKETLKELKETLTKDRKMIMIISIILVTGSGVVANMEPVKKLLMNLLGLH